MNDLKSSMYFLKYCIDTLKEPIRVAEDSLCGFTYPTSVFLTFNVSQPSWGHRCPLSGKAVTKTPPSDTDLNIVFDFEKKTTWYNLYSEMSFSLDFMCESKFG